jgi:protoporphyrinogen oxidase
MDIAVVGAGFTGLAAGLKLSSAGHRVTVFEREDSPGGLAAGFRLKNWDWPLEKHYHHVFASDGIFTGLARETGIETDFYRPLTSVYYQGKIRQVDSPLSLLGFSGLPFADRLRTGFGLASLKINPYWKLLEAMTAREYIIKVFGENSWKVLWAPLFSGKFGIYADEISAAWFWARIVSRTSRLGYPRGGFGQFAAKLADRIEKSGGRVLFNQPVSQISSGSEKLSVKIDPRPALEFDRVLCTLPTRIFALLAPDLPEEYKERIASRVGLGAVTLVLTLKKSFLPGVYWLNINDRTLPFLSVVEHTHLIDPSHYAGNHILYIGNYLPADHPYFSLTDKQLIRLFLPHLTKINPQFSLSWISNSRVFKEAFAQPVITTYYSHRLLPFKTPVAGLFLANMEQVYPWDRGVNYAIKSGQEAANEIIRSV